jgi:serine/threonine protein phosphatase PrpC
MPFYERMNRIGFKPAEIIPFKRVDYRTMQPRSIWSGSPFQGANSPLDPAHIMRTASFGTRLPKPFISEACDANYPLRKYNEDRHVNLEINGGRLLAVMDGHGGARTAEILERSIGDVFKRSLDNHKDDASEALRNAVGELHKLTKDQKEGATLSMVYVPRNENRAYVAVLGDAPVYILDENGNLVTSPEHKISNLTEKEMEALTRKGIESDAYVFGDRLRKPGAGAINLARALGDGPFGDLLGKEADVYSVPLSEKSIILIGSDGIIYPTASKTEQSEQPDLFLSLINGGADARSIVNMAKVNGSTDNITAMVMTFKEPLPMVEREMVNAEELENTMPG